MFISEDFVPQINQIGLYLRKGVELNGQGFFGIRSELRAGSNMYPSHLANFSMSNLGSYSIANPASFYNTSIGNYCSIADGVKIVAHHAMDRISTSICTVKTEVSAEVFENFKGKREFINSFHTFIGHDVWLGSNVVIKDGLVIGHGAVVGANSVVTKNVPPYTIIAGAPARIIRMRFPDEDIERLLKSSWYIYDWNNIEVDWGDLHHCLDIMEEHIAAQDVPLIGDGYLYQCLTGNRIKFTPAQWTLERQLNALYKTADMQKLFELPMVQHKLVK